MLELAEAVLWLWEQEVGLAVQVGWEELTGVRMKMTAGVGPEATCCSHSMAELAVEVQCSPH